MALDKAIRRKIICLHNQGLSERDIASRLLEAKSTVHDTVSRYKKTGTVEIKPRKPRFRPVRTRQLVNKVRNKLIRNPHRSLGDMSKEYEIPKTTLRRVLKFDLKKTCFKFTRRQVLSEATVAKRLQRGRIIRDKIACAPHPATIWSDEKIFTVQRAWNRQNDRFYACNLEDIPLYNRSVFIRQHPAHVMVWAGVSDDGRKTPLVVIPEGTKVNSDAYINLLEEELLPWIQQQHWEHGYAFMQDGAPAHTSKKTQGWCKANLMDFWDKNTWPPSSPDLNPMDFSI
ncbi:uncharacterized protein LOC131879599 [Tigriopus californicus]|uniref:uncharacterized protein LOC131879599 n=1 Tax=Tigriopus californicus TaxID=6832 RepID=UPI0027DA2C5A|nr:uncharacterized protein LOC131879599 [Tigriopus californicus]